MPPFNNNPVTNKLDFTKEKFVHEEIVWFKEVNILIPRSGSCLSWLGWARVKHETQKWNMNPKDIVYKMVVLGRRLTTHFILDIFWGSSFMFHVWVWDGNSRARTWQKGTGNTDTIFLSNALPVTVTGSIWQEVSVCDTGNARAYMKQLNLTDTSMKRYT